MRKMPLKSLVVYYTRTGNAKFVADLIASQLGSDIEEIIDKKSRGGPLGWVSAGKDSTQEKETEIAQIKLSPTNYDLVIIGTPIWAWRPTPAIRTYIKQNDLSGKKIAFFFTMDNAPKEAVERAKALIPNSTFVSHLLLAKALKNKEETEKKVIEWCNTLKQ
jgi:flavodoxin